MSKIKRNWLGEIEDEDSEDELPADSDDEYLYYGYDSPADDYIYDPYKECPF